MKAATQPVKTAIKGHAPMAAKPGRCFLWANHCAMRLSLCTLRLTLSTLRLSLCTLLAASGLLTACTTPSLGHRGCNPNECHFYGPATPYVRTAAATPGGLDHTNSLTHPRAEQVDGIEAASVATAETGQQDLTLGLSNPRFSVGDRLSVMVLNGPEFSDEVEINADGFVYLNFLPPINAAGRHLQQLERAIHHAIVDEQLMLPTAVRVSVRPVSWAPIEVLVSGAVFEPGQHLINQRPERMDPGESQSGDLGEKRTIAAALRASGGIRPDANPSRILLTRGNAQVELDLSGTLSGERVPDWLLQAGDRIHVPSSKQFDETLVRPSQITVPGIRVFISNLTQPASSNSQSAVDREATRFPYGTRLLAGAIAANCVGGAQTSNASRQVLLVTQNPLTDQTEVVERSLDGLLKDAWRPEMNPVLLPGDGIACYDSSVTNMRELARTFSDLLLPLTLAGLL